MTTNFGFFEDGNGDKSSSRLIGVIAIAYALLQSSLIIILGHIELASIVVTSAASSANFLAIAGPAMIYLFNNKKEELNSEVVV